VLFEPFEGQTPDDLHAEAVALFEALHALPIHDTEGRATFYREKILRSPALARLKEAFDTWCAIWFWPAMALDSAPLPLTFAQPPDETRAVLAQLVGEHRFFHWELEFPDVFAAPGSGFDAVLGNPPWEIQKPNSQEFFSNVDPLYRTYGKQEALRQQQERFSESQETEQAWLDYCGRLKALSNWSSWAHAPWGDPADESTPNFNPFKGKGSKIKADQFHDTWRRARAGRRGYADPEHPYLHQGSADINTYKMFLEQAHALLRPGGTLAMIAPSGLYTDKGSTDLRTLFLERCRWLWLFGFENRERIFDIHRSFKFGPVIVQKGGTTDAIRTAFMRRRLRDWAEAEHHAIPYRRAQVERFSPHTRAILEIRSRRDLEILETMYSHSGLLGDDRSDGWNVRYTREFHMVDDSALFRQLPKWEAEGYRPDEYGRWIDPSGQVALPLYQGVMVGRLEPNRARWISGAGNRALWEKNVGPFSHFRPQFLVARMTALKEKPGIVRRRFVLRSVARTTDERTIIGSLVPSFPSGHSLATVRTEQGPVAMIWSLSGCVSSTVLDWCLRQRLGGTNISWAFLEELPVPPPQRITRWLAELTCRLSAPGIGLADAWLEGIAPDSALRRFSWKSLWAVTPFERLRLFSIVDAVVAELYGLNWEDLAWILRECDYPAAVLRDDAFARTLDSKGFWRMDKDKDPELRHTMLTLAAFRDLQAAIGKQGGDRERGIEAFCSQNDGDGWMLPDMLCLEDLGLGHDERAKRPQAVRDRLGERFYPWQLEQSIEESWAECERHARNLLGAEGFARLEAELRGEPMEVGEAALLKVAEEGPTPYGPGTSGAQRRLFPGEPTLFGDGTEDPPVTKRKRRRP
jgi:hypothetical protein